MNAKHYIRKYFPGIVELKNSAERKKRIMRINQRKKKTEEEYPKILETEYRKKFGHELDWNSLNTYTEKMQWAKIYDKDPKKSLYSDKYLVREWITEVLGEGYLIPLLGVWRSFDEIDFSLLPNRFVLKTNNGSGTNIIVKDKTNFDKSHAKKKINDWLNTDYGFISMELHYSRIKPLIIAEKYIETDNGDLQDYKFLCFNGKPYYCWVDTGRFTDHRRNVYNLNWELQPWNQETYSNTEKPIDKPKNFEKMVEIATTLAAGFSHVRVDLYNVNGKIYFGEMTFSNGGGFDRIIPETYDKMLGDLWHIDLTRS